MNNYFEHNDKIVFHPGYYIKEFMEESELPRESFAQKLGLSIKDFNLLIKGARSLSYDIAVTLSKVVGTSVEYWLNLQNTYELLSKESKAERESVKEGNGFIDLNDFKNMKIIESKRCLCVCCMEKHEIKTVLVPEQTTYKDVRINYDAIYLYCENAEVLYMNEPQMQENYIKIKKAYEIHQEQN